MSDDVILKAVNISKQYRLGLVGTGTLSHDLNRLWAKIRGKEDPYLKVGAVNDRSAAATSDYVWALQDINFEVKRGEILGIIGKNGAGKSTLLKILSRVTSPTTGSIKTKGRIASLLEVGTGMHPELTGRENIFLNGAILGMTKTEISSKIDEIVEFSGCQMYIDTPVKRYSSGMRVRLGFAVAAFLEPDILVVDEVLAVGDAEFQKKAIGKMQDISNTSGRTVLFVSHNMAAVKNLCTRAIVLKNGVSTFNGNTNEAVEFYLNNTDSLSTKFSLFTKAHKPKLNTREVELIYIKSISSNNLTLQQLSYEVELKVNEDLDELLCLTGTICTLDGVALGSFFTSSFLLESEQFCLKFGIINHNLSIGTYLMHLSISKGSQETSNLVPIDQVYSAIGIQIVNKDSDSDHHLKWDRSWGAINFKAIINE
jgi:lipopolysaccharide transport system ATP-binding protein